MEQTVTAGTLPPGFRVGRFTLRDGRSGSSNVWIGLGDGEGGDFDAAEVEKVIAEFYTEHF